jgi:hypothetical protein
LGSFVGFVGATTSGGSDWLVLVALFLQIFREAEDVDILFLFLLQSVAVT